MEGQNALHVGVLKDALCDHGSCASCALFVGLEEELDGEGQMAALGGIFFEHHGCSEKGCGMDVMTAGVHDAGVLRFERRIRHLCDGEGVNICSYGNSSGRVIAV